MRRTTHHKLLRLSIPFALLAALVCLSGCFREMPSEKPPIHLNPDMDKQPKYKAQSESEFFADRSAMRQPVPGTVPADQIDEDPAFFTGIDQQGDTVAHSPLPVTMLSLERGRERFNIYCSPCHGRVGDGQGIMVSRGYVPPPSFHDDRIRVLSDGHIFDVITNGIRNMPAYRHQIPPEDRWAIVNYLRALQRSQHATMEDIPVERRGAIK